MTTQRRKGIVEISVSEDRNCGGRITLVKLAGSTEKFNISGQHRIDQGERINFIYRSEFAVNWVDEYSILDKNGQPKYTSKQ